MGREETGVEGLDPGGGELAVTVHAESRPFLGLIPLHGPTQTCNGGIRDNHFLKMSVLASSANLLHQQIKIL